MQLGTEVFLKRDGVNAIRDGGFFKIPRPLLDFTWKCNCHFE